MAAKRMEMGDEGLRGDQVDQMEMVINQHDQEIESLLYEEQELINRNNMLRQMHQQRLEAAQ